MRHVWLITISFFIFGCQVPEKYHAQLAQQRLAPRPGHEGYLTHRICKQSKFWGGCEIYDIKTYDINDPEVRVMMNDFRIACRIGGKRFRISLDKPGFVRREHGKCKDKKLFSNKCKKWEYNEDFIPIENYDYLIEASTECMAGL